MTRILFICHGNICRSTSAQYVMQFLVDEAGLTKDFYIDSAATSREEIGNSVYPPMKKTLKGHGIPCEGHRARQMTMRDYEEFDLLIGMDRENMRHLAYLFPNDPMHKIHMLGEYSSGKEIDDPWYTGDFDTCYEEILAGCCGLAEALK